ncbi:MAG: TolC family protein [Paludibacteraceae bacterium]|nr:TolC family protein [Paludibacteraceae bacterium]MBO7368468.1 TolC family protein [Paludibacteraceae bacterium]
MKRVFVLTWAVVAATLTLCAQNDESFKDWTLDKCLQYALDNNTTVLKSITAKSSAEQDLRKSKAAFAPTVSASTNQGYTYRNMLGPDNESVYNASYGISAGMTLFNGGRLTYTKRQNDVLLQASQEGILNTKKQVQRDVLSAYLTVLYNNETVKTNEKIFELSTAEYERSKIMYEVGKITKSDLAQVATQWSQNKFNLSKSRNTLRTAILSLKQLLEISIDVEFSVAIPEISDDEILAPLPGMMDIYNTAMETMPSIKQAELNIKSAEIGKRVAQGNWMPTVSLSAGLSGSYTTANDISLGEQFKTSLGPTAGISINVPIYDQRTAKTAVNKAKINIENNKIAYQQAEMKISKDVESLYVDALNAQDNYINATEKLGFAQDSYDLAAEQYNVGMKNTVEMLTEEKNLFQAQQEVVQCRYQAIISIQLLNILQDKEIKVGTN